MIKFLALLVISVSSSIGVQSQPATRSPDDQWRLTNSLDDYFLLNSAEALQNMFNDKAGLKNKLGMCKEIGIFSAEANKLDNAAKYSPDVKKRINQNDAKEFQTLRWYANDLHAFCGDAIDAQATNKDREGNVKFLIEQMLNIKPHLEYVLELDKRIKMGND